MIPYAASARWYARWLYHRLDGLSDSEAVKAASAFLAVDRKMLRK